MRTIPWPCASWSSVRLMKQESIGLPEQRENADQLRLWHPRPGPQTDAITARWCSELFYGGAAGDRNDFLLATSCRTCRTWKGTLFAE